MRKPFCLIIVVLMTALTLIGCSRSSSTPTQFKSEPVSYSGDSSDNRTSQTEQSSTQVTDEDLDRLAREKGYEDLDDLQKSVNEREALEVEVEELQRQAEAEGVDLEQALEDELARRRGQNSRTESPAYSEGYNSSSGPSSSPSYGSSTMGGYGAGVESRIEQQRSADRIQRDEEARRLNAIRNGP